MQNFEIIVVDDNKLIESIANIKRPVSETFIRENYKQLSFTDEELIRKKTGLLARMFPTSWVAPYINRKARQRVRIFRNKGPFPPVR